jgi:hypothetical protein
MGLIFKQDAVIYVYRPAMGSPIGPLRPGSPVRDPRTEATNAAGRPRNSRRILRRAKKLLSLYVIQCVQCCRRPIEQNTGLTGIQQLRSRTRQEETLARPDHGPLGHDQSAARVA